MLSAARRCLCCGSAVAQRPRRRRGGAAPAAQPHDGTTAQGAGAQRHGFPGGGLVAQRHNNQTARWHGGAAAQRHSGATRTVRGSVCERA
jgi:hypothetical protein